MTDDHKEKSEHHPEFDDPTANLVIKSEDGISFRIHDFYLKSNSPVFRDMLALSANKTNNVVPLPESSKHLANLFRAITGKVDDVNKIAINFEDSAELYKLTQKYDFEACVRTWTTCLLRRFTGSQPLECFALACESSPTDMALAHAAILAFPKTEKAKMSGHVDASLDVQDHLCFSPTFAPAVNPARWTNAYIQRLGLKNYSSYVYAWDFVFLARYAISRNKSSDQALKQLADTFLLKLDEK